MSFLKPLKFVPLRARQGAPVKTRIVHILLPFLLWADITDAGTHVSYYTGPKTTIRIDRGQLREIFFLRCANWEDGTPIRIFVMPDQDPLHIRFAKEILGVFPYQLRSAWDRMVFSGIAAPPTVVYSAEEMRKRVDATPGAIGYLEQ